MQSGFCWDAREHGRDAFCISWSKSLDAFVILSSHFVGNKLLCSYCGWGMDEILHHLSHHGKPLFVGIYKIILNPGLLHCDLWISQPSTGLWDQGNLSLMEG